MFHHFLRMVSKRSTEVINDKNFTIHEQNEEDIETMSAALNNNEYFKHYYENSTIAQLKLWSRDCITI